MAAAAVGRQAMSDAYRAHRLTRFGDGRGVFRASAMATSRFIAMLLQFPRLVACIWLSP